ncbi:MAG: toll/interleukin-1 receptor domain-containing protein [Hyphomonadaceae bacterium]|nr:toll/interleukin-1 receptor domain-containing protein [Hyphomonadaceae bacterium]
MGRAIFLSYRRADTSDVVGRVNDALVGAFGESQIFRDVDSIPMGADFAAHIGATLRRCRVVLAFIGPDWAEVRDEQGRRRLDDPNDLVRVELETALETSKLLVVPILVNGARMPNREELPISLRDLVARNAGTMRRDPDFRADMGRLVDALRAHLRTGRLDLSALGGVATRAAGISGAAVAAWLALAGVVGVAGVVPEIREPIISAAATLFRSNERDAPTPAAPTPVSAESSDGPADVPANILPTPEQAVASPAQQIASPAQEPPSERIDPIVGRWTDGVSVFDFRADRSVVAQVRQEAANGRSVPLGVGTWRRTGATLYWRQNATTSLGNSFTQASTCQITGGSLECDVRYVQPTSCELSEEGGNHITCSTGMILYGGPAAALVRE